MVFAAGSPQALLHNFPPGFNQIIFFFVTEPPDVKFRVFVHGKPFHQSLIFLGKASLLSGNTKGGGIAVLLTSCLTGLD